MALDPLELGSIAAILLVFFLWGPQKIPELARIFAQARKEFDNATREFQKVTAGLQNGTSPLLAPVITCPQGGRHAATTALPDAPNPRSAPPCPDPPCTSTVKTGDQLLIEAARKLGIPTQGKTREQIQQEIIAMAQRSSGTTESSPPATARTIPPA